jgi:hypothetical protein
MLKFSVSVTALTVAVFCTPTFAAEDLGQEWIKAMNACEMLVSKQSFASLREYSDAPSTLNVDPQLERGFQHTGLPLNVSALSDGSEWFLCVVTGDTREELGSIVGAVTGTLTTQIRTQGNLSSSSKDSRTFAPVRVICRDGGQFTMVLAYLDDKNKLRVAAFNKLPNGTNPCE